MGSTDIANKRGLILSEGSARAGIIQVIEENVVNMRGYDKRTIDQPCLKERILKYFEHLDDDYGGVVIQQNVENQTMSYGIKYILIRNSMNILRED